MIINKKGRYCNQPDTERVLPKMKRLFVIVTLLTAFAASAQDSLSLPKDSLYYKLRFPSFRPTFILGKKNIMHRDEKNIFNVVPASIPYFKKYKNRLAVGFISACVAAADIVLMESPKKQGTKNILRFSGIALFINAEFWLISSMKNLKKAVKVRNHEVLKY